MHTAINQMTLFLSPGGSDNRAYFGELSRTMPPSGPKRLSYEGTELASRYVTSHEGTDHLASRSVLHRMLKPPKGKKDLLL